MQTAEPQAVITPAESERNAFATVARLLAYAAGHDPVFIAQGSERVALPSTAVYVLQRLAQALAEGTPMALLPLHGELRTQAAADFLGVSRPYLVGLLDRGEIPCTWTGNQRRVRIDDLLAYKAQRDAARRAGLDALVQMSEDLELYTD